VNPASEPKFTEVAITERCFEGRDLTDL